VSVLVIGFLLFPGKEEQLIKIIIIRAIPAFNRILLSFFIIIVHWNRMDFYGQI
jgi:hypothetical protein